LLSRSSNDAVRHRNSIMIKALRQRRCMLNNFRFIYGQKTIL
jgi:hypothetical protein